MTIPATTGVAFIVGLCKFGIELLRFDHRPTVRLERPTDAVFQIAPQLLAEWQEQTKRAAGVRQLLSVAAAPAAATEASNPERVARWGRMVAKLLARRERLATAPARPTVSLRVEDYF